MSDQWMDRLSEYLDGELTEGERVALKAHLQECRGCSGVLHDLRRVAARARTLDDLPPARDLWPEIAQRIGAGRTRHEVVDLATHRRPARRWSFSVPQLAAAAIALMTLSGGTVWLLRGSGPATTPASVVTTPTQPSVSVVSASRGSARQSVAQAVADLEQVLANGRGQLDTTTVRVIEQNLAAIDQAIAQAQKALNADPGNLYLNTHLAETMRRKLELLRQAAALVPVS
jgi:predicted anti-sigma-YlaC factor YlaD